MIFAEDTQVIYEGKFGVIDFTCETYVVIKFLAAPERNPPRLLVYRQNYKNIEIKE